MSGSDRPPIAATHKENSRRFRALPIDISAHFVRLTGRGDIQVENATRSATIIDANTITFDGGLTFQTYTYLGSGRYRGFGEEGEFIRVGGQIYGYNALNPTGPMRNGNWRIGLGSLDPSNPPCFLRGTRILTPRGEVPVEDLKPGDEVMTASGVAAPILWIGGRRLVPGAVHRDPGLRPIEIAAGFLGNTRPLRVSQQHRVLIEGARAELLFGAPEVLVPAKSLLVSDRAFVMPPFTEVEYFHILLPEHMTLYAEGALVESLYLGDQMGAELRREIDVLFPELSAACGRAGSAAPVLSVREGRTLFI